MSTIFRVTMHWTSPRKRAEQEEEIWQQMIQKKTQVDGVIWGVRGKKARREASAASSSNVPKDTKRIKRVSIAKISPWWKGWLGHVLRREGVNELFDSIRVDPRGLKGNREDYLEKDCWERQKSGGVEELEIMLTENIELILKCDSHIGAMRWDEDWDEFYNESWSWLIYMNTSDN